MGGARGATNELLLTSQLSRSIGGERVTLIIEHRYGLVHNGSGDGRAAWSAQTAEYFYTVEASDGREILAYH